MNKLLGLISIVFILQAASAQDCKDIKYNIISAGFNFGDYLLMTVGGVTIIDTNAATSNNSERGIIIAQVNENNGDFIEYRAFDTHASAAKSEEMAAYINQIPEGRVIMAGVNDEGAHNLGASGILALKSFGAPADFKLNYRESMALVGVKGKTGENMGFVQSLTDKVNIETEFRMCQGQPPKPSTGGQTCKDIDYNIISAGFNFGDYLLMTVGGVTIIDTNAATSNNSERGIIIAQVNENNGDFIEYKAFDTYASAAKSEEMAAYINQIPDGRVIMAGVNDEGSNNLGASGILALQSFGAPSDFKLNFRESMALVGVKGKTGENMGFVQSTTDKVNIETKFRMCEGQAPSPIGEDEEVGPNPECAQLYSECDFQGNMVEICEENSNLGDMTVKSVQVPAERSITLWVQTDFGGRYVTYGQSVNCIERTSWNNPQFLLQNKITVVEKNTHKQSHKKHLRTNKKH